MHPPDVLALIPARGGSKGIPRKNIRLVAGKPLIAYSIRQALEAPSITRVIVSTEDEEIAVVATDWGAEVPFLRPAAYAQDLSPDLDVFRHALTWLAENENYRPELVVQLRPTAPVRRIEHIEDAIARMRARPDADSLRSVTWPDQTPYKMFLIEGGLLRPAMSLEGVPEPFTMPRQMLPPVYWGNGYLDVLRPRVVLKKNRMCGDVILPFVMEEKVFELDYEESFAEVEEAIRAMEAGALPAAARSFRHPV